jgi:hypothetical protein
MLDVTFNNICFDKRPNVPITNGSKCYEKNKINLIQQQLQGNSKPSSKAILAPCPNDGVKTIGGGGGGG